MDNLLKFPIIENPNKSNTESEGTLLMFTPKKDGIMINTSKLEQSKNLQDFFNDEDVLFIG